MKVRFRKVETVITYYLGDEEVILSPEDRLLYGIYGKSSKADSHFNKTVEEELKCMTFPATYSNFRHIKYIADSIQGCNQIIIDLD